MAYLHEITLGDPRIGVQIGKIVLKTDERFRMIKVGDGKLLLKGSRNKFMLERLTRDVVWIDLWGERTLFKPPQIHLLRALLKMNCTCKMCKQRSRWA
jgi:hypothetical protein